MIIYIFVRRETFVRRDKKGLVNECLTNYEATAPPRVGEYLNIYLEHKGCSSNYIVEWIKWHITDKGDKGLLTVEVYCKEVGWSNKL